MLTLIGSDRRSCANEIKSNQVYLRSPNITVTSPQWALRSVMWATSIRPQTFDSSEEKLYKQVRGILQERHTIDVACTEKNIWYKLWYMESVWTTEQAEASPSGARARRPPLHRDLLEEGRPHEMISSKTEKTRGEEAWDLTEIQINMEIVNSSRAMIQQSPGCDDPYASICEAAGARRGRRSVRREPEWKERRGRRTRTRRRKL